MVAAHALRAPLEGIGDPRKTMARAKTHAGTLTRTLQDVALVHQCLDKVADRWKRALPPPAAGHDGPARCVA